MCIEPIFSLSYKLIKQTITGDQAWPLVLTDLNYFIDHGLGKKIILTENGWPSEHYPGVEPNSPNAVSSVASEEVSHLFFELTPKVDCHESRRTTKSLTRTVQTSKQLRAVVSVGFGIYTGLVSSLLLYLGLQLTCCLTAITRSPVMGYMIPMGI